MCGWSAGQWVAQRNITGLGKKAERDLRKSYSYLEAGSWGVRSIVGREDLASRLQ